MTEVKPAQLAQLARLVDEYLDRHTFANTGRLLWEALATGADDGMSQLRSLQNTVYSATRFSDIIDFIKNQMGKESLKNRRWTRNLEGQMVGAQLLAQLDRLKADAAGLAAQLGQDPDHPYLGTFPVALRLARGWMRQVAAHYLYCKALKGAGGS